MFKKAVSLLLFALILALVSACTPVSAPAANEGADAEETGTSRGTLRVPHFLARDGAESLDPASPTEFSYATYLLYDRLVALNDQGVLEPELATAWEANADATAWTFTLKRRSKPLPLRPAAKPGLACWR